MAWRTGLGVILGLSVVGAATAVLSVGGSASEPHVPTARAMKRTFAMTVETVGELDAARSTVVASAVRGDRGRIIWLVHEGDRVSEGDDLVRLDPTPFQEELVRARTRLAELEATAAASSQSLEWERVQGERDIAVAAYEIRLAELDLQKLESGDGLLELARLESVASEAQQVYEELSAYVLDLNSLGARGLLAAPEVAQAQKKVNDAKKTWERAHRQLVTYQEFVLPTSVEKAQARHVRAQVDADQVRRSVAVKIARAEAQVSQVREQVRLAHDALQSAERELMDTVLTAPIPGMVVYREEFRNGERRKPRIGDAVWQSQPLLYLPDVSRMIVNTHVREVDLHRVVLGATVTVRVDAFPAETLHGTVEGIGVLAQRESAGAAGAKRFQVSVAVSQVHERLRPGMTARVSIHVADVRDAVCVPLEALFYSDLHPFCYVWKQGAWQRGAVSVGSSNDHHVEITAGLGEGDRVALIPP